MSSPNIFAEDWQACLHAHYLHVLREDDTTNEANLRLVLMQVGFDEEALHGMRAEIPADARDAAMAVVDVELVMEHIPEVTAQIVETVIEEIAAEADMPQPEELLPDDEPQPPDEEVRPSQLSLF